MATKSSHIMSTIEDAAYSRTHDSISSDSKVEEILEVEATACTEAVAIRTQAPAEALAGLTRHLASFLLVIIVIVSAFATGVWLGIPRAESAIMMPWRKKPANNRAAVAQKSVGFLPSISLGTVPDLLKASIPGQNTSSEVKVTLKPLSKLLQVAQIRHWSGADSSTVVVDLGDQVQYEAHRLTGPERIYFDLHGAQIAPTLAGKSIPVGDALLNQIRMAEPVPG